jgi:hypothetical protein
VAFSGEVNDPEIGPDGFTEHSQSLNPVLKGDIREAFKTYYATSELAEATDPNLILDLKTKLDAQGHYDEFEIDRVVNVGAS